MLELLKQLERRIRNLEITSLNLLKIGKVVNRYPDKGTVRVEFERADEKDKTVSYELSVLQPKTLKDKFYYMPEEGEYVICIFLPYAPDVGFVLGAYYNKIIPTPIADNNKFHIKFEDGTSFEYDKRNNKLTINVNKDAEININNQLKLTSKTKTEEFNQGSLKMSVWQIEGDITLQGNLTVLGNINSTGTTTAQGGLMTSPAGLKMMVDDFLSVYNTHTHTDSAGGTTSSPNQTY